MEDRSVTSVTDRAVLAYLNRVDSAELIAQAIGGGYDAEESKKIAEQLIAARNESRSFGNLQQLIKIPGIGVERFESIVDALRQTVARSTGIVRRRRRSMVVVKFQNSFEIPYEDKAEEALKGTDLKRWQELQEKFPRISLTRLFTRVPASRITELVERAKKLNQDYSPPNFLTYFNIIMRNQVVAEDLVRALLDWDSLEFAYVADGQTPPPTPVNRYNNIPFASQQFHLDPSPLGINAEYAWAQPGGAGQNVKFFDVEGGWQDSHPDLVDPGIVGGDRPSIPLISGVNETGDPDLVAHGTRVLGVVASLDNTAGCVGIAPRANIFTIGETDWETLTCNRPNGMMSAVDSMQCGDVLLLQGQVSAHKLPVETEPACFQVIELASNNNFIVVEPAGNGPGDVGIDLDGEPSMPEPDKDSGAILVSSAQWDDWDKNYYQISNYGARVDCFAPEGYVDHDGNIVNITTADSAASRYTTAFGGSSAASAIIAGAAVVLQSITKQTNPGFYLNPMRMRELLVNGTNSQNPAVDKIGVMPDLKKIIQDQTNRFDEVLDPCP